MPDNEWISVPIENINTSFSGGDAIASITVPGGKTYVFGELQTISISTHREKHPVRALRRANPRGFSYGPRTIAGSLIFTVFDESMVRKAMRDLIEAGENVLPDEMPPFNITLYFANESGVRSMLTLYGVTIVDNGMTVSIEDMITEDTMSYMALDIDLLQRTNEIPQPPPDDSVVVAPEPPPKRKTVVGTVHDFTDDSPLAGVYLIFSDKDGNIIDDAMAATDEGGSYTASLPPGEHEVTVVANGSASKAGKIEVSDDGSKHSATIVYPGKVKSDTRYMVRLRVLEKKYIIGLFPKEEPAKGKIVNVVLEDGSVRSGTADTNGLVSFNSLYQKAVSVKVHAGDKELTYPLSQDYYQYKGFDGVEVMAAVVDIVIDDRGANPKIDGRPHTLTSIKLSDWALTPDLPCEFKLFVKTIEPLQGRPGFNEVPASGSSVHLVCESGKSVNAAVDANGMALLTNLDSKPVTLDLDVLKNGELIVHRTIDLTEYHEFMFPKPGTSGRVAVLAMSYMVPYSTDSPDMFAHEVFRIYDGQTWKIV